MPLSNQEVEMLLEDLKKPNVSISKLARLYGLPLIEIMRAIGIAPPADPSNPYRNSKFGPENLRPFIISVRQKMRPWPLRDSKRIQKAREDYDAGFVEMVQGRDGPFVLLYSIPRVKPIRDRHPYFSYREED